MKYPNRPKTTNYMEVSGNPEMTNSGHSSAFFLLLLVPLRSHWMIQCIIREDLKLLQKDDKLLENGEMCETNLITKGDRLDFRSMMNGYPKHVELLKLLKPSTQSSFN